MCFGTANGGGLADFDNKIFQFQLTHLDVSLEAREFDVLSACHSVPFACHWCIAGVAIGEPLMSNWPQRVPNGGPGPCRATNGTWENVPFRVTLHRLFSILSYFDVSSFSRAMAWFRGVSIWNSLRFTKGTLWFSGVYALHGHSTKSSIGVGLPTSDSSVPSHHGWT